MAQTFEHIGTYPGVEEGQIKIALNQAAAIVKENLKEYTQKFESSNTINGFYDATENVEWTTGFWTGVIWLAYEYTGEACFLDSGSIQVDSFLKRIEEKIDVNHHDMGFLYSL
ncbi:MAG: glucoronyl hydrolase, partial [Hungatella sp.]